MSDSFVHLHVHTEYSMLDGAARLKDLFAEANRLGMPAVAITDHGNMHGAYDFYTQATAAGVTPVIGIEAYVAPESRLHKARVKWGRPEQKSDDISGNGAITHKTMWARNAQGLKNLFRLSSRASMEGHYVKWPRMDMDIIAEHAEGIMATTGCPSGAVQTRLRLGQDDEAYKVAAQYQEIFGKENYFLEIMDHGLEIENRVRDGLLDISRRLGIPPLVTNDSHYTHEAQAEAHDVLLCVQTGSNIADPNRFRFDGGGYFIKSADQMRAVDSSDAWLEGCRNTLLVAEKVDTEGMFTFKNLMPRFPVPEGHTEESWFRHEAYEGLKRRFPGGIPETHVKQAEYELGVISQMGFPSYFLVVADFIQWSKRNGIAVGPGRGSAAGSLIAYAMGITDLDPLPHGLIFERFLNPERVSMPDVDIDFDERRRGEVIRYVTDRWGEDKVAQIATFGTIKAKAAIKDSARVLGYPFAVGDRITKALPPDVMGKGIPLSGIFDKDHKRYSEAGEVRALYEQDPDVKKVIDTARGIEGLIRQTGVHAAGVIMSAEPIIDHIPLMRRATDGVIITQFDYPTCETLGLLKMDFLGLRNLTIIDDAVKNIQLNHGMEMDLLALPLDDKPAYELLARGDTLGVFQLDGGPMRSLLRLMKPDNFEDISAVLALYRPGPMGVESHTNYALRKNKLQEITPIHPELEEPLREILEPTYGLIVYQEQVQRAAQILAGYTLGQADLLRRAMGKKKKEILDKEFKPFREGCRQHGYSDEAIQAVWDVLVPFAGYAFNKAHSAAYGLVSYWTAYLKAHYPAEYMAGLLTSVGDDKDKMAMYLAECRRMGIQVLPPDVNESAGPFTPVGKDIRFGLAAIRNVGHNVVEAVARCREEKGKYQDFYDFLSKVDAVACNKKTIESLIKAGAFDSMGHSRKGLLAVHAEAIDAYADVKRNEAAGQFDLFGAFGDEAGGASATVAMPTITDGEWDKRDKLAFEREMLGLYVSDHPLAGLEQVLANAADTTIAALNEEGSVPDGQVVTLAGILTGVQRRITKQGRPWASATLEDLAGGVETLFFPNTYEVIGQYIAEDAIVVVKGRVDRRDDTPRIMAMDMSMPDVTHNPDTKPITLTMPITRCTPPLVSELKEILVSHPGDSEVHVHLLNGSRKTVMRLGGFKVAATPALRADLKMILGPSAVA
ncbi:DNA polymerase III subunit alpha [Actinoplanes sp. NBRC 14428]|uniref:DNA polymerase III subunit alpha n=1 Tax=Pseudosporangium ferrugineum TaxID=439699 RepID=A0A2T0S9J7_9ACTN|nr:DNA polymerase III subunit alpha [Pseudosporangium ferrugineum]PRY30061.1 DNA polymerase-3 subunit alpha [Pseudosporangium ferrugineum]BCJ51035.1 DNA polymerase III subunit alpha [Actinoplanes sp. NBRC 14428]